MKKWHFEGSSIRYGGEEERKIVEELLFLSNAFHIHSNFTKVERSNKPECDRGRDVELEDCLRNVLFAIIEDKDCSAHHQVSKDCDAHRNQSIKDQKTKKEMYYLKTPLMSLKFDSYKTSSNYKCVY